MIGRLQGTLVEKKPPMLMIDVSGVGYEVESPMSTFYQLPEIGEQVALHTHLLIREDSHTLYGFIREYDRALFRQLIRINGVGARMALAILSGMDAETFSMAIRQADWNRLTSLPGIGKKTAERLIVEMRDRLPDVSTLPMSDENQNGRESNAMRPPDREAIDALMALGYRLKEAEMMIRQVEGENLTVESMIREALRKAVK